MRTVGTDWREREMKVCMLVSLVFLCTGVLLASAQPWDSWDTCSLDNYTTPLYTRCYVDDFGEPCSGLYCYDNNEYIEVISIFVQKCEDPVTVAVYYKLYEFRVGYEEFQYVYNQSETVDNDGYYSYYYYYYYRSSSGVNYEISSYTGIMERNASHVGFELFVERDGEDTPVWLLYPVYIPLDPADCLCSSMQNVAEDIHLLSDFSCNTTVGNCAEIVCDVVNSPLQFVSMQVIQCDSPPSLDISIVLQSSNYHISTNTNRTLMLTSVGATLYIKIWHYDYSMDVELTIASSDIIQIILSRHKIILDLTSCGPPRPIDLSHEPTHPPTSFTEPTVIPTTDSTDPTYDTCAALKSVTVLDGTLCTTNEACNALECEIVNQRLQIAVDSCHSPPGINVSLYDSTNNLLYNRSFYNGSTVVTDPRLPMALNVTVVQLSSTAISVEVIGELQPQLSNYRIVLVPKTVIPIDKSSCTTLVPPTAAPSGTCSAMQYIQSALSVVAVESCYFPVPNNCSTLTCPIGQGLDLTIYILRCAHPPGVRIVYGTGFFTLFDHTFDHSEVVPLDMVEENTALNVTLDQLCPSDIGLQVDLKSDFGSTTLIPYTVVPINTTGCGPGSGTECPSTSTPTASTDRPTDPGPPPTPPSQPVYGTETCDAMTRIGEELRINMRTAGAEAFSCSVTSGCETVDCVGSDGELSITLSCSPFGVYMIVVNGTQPPEMELFTEDGTLADYLQVRMDSTRTSVLGFGLKIVVGDSFEFELIGYSDIPVVTSDGSVVCSGPTDTPTPHTDDTPTPHTDDTPTPHTDDTLPSTGSVSPTHSTTEPSEPSFSSETCDALTLIADQLEKNIDVGECTVSDTCGEVKCAKLSISLWCSPIGIEMKFVNGTEPESRYFNESGTFQRLFQVTVNVTEDDKVIGFALSVYVEGALNFSVVNYTLIPVDSCVDSSESDKSKGIADSTLATAVAVPVVVIMIVLVTIIVVITGLYLIKRRRYRHYQLHRMTMSQLDDEEGDC